MKNGFVFSDYEFELIGQGQMSLGHGLEVSQRFAYDYSRSPQAIAYRKKRGVARRGSVSMAFKASQVKNVFNEVARYEALAGQTGFLWWNGQSQGRFLIRSVQLSFAVDGIDIISSVQVGLEIQEGFIPRTTTANMPNIEM